MIAMRQLLATNGIPSNREREQWWGKGQGAIGETPWNDPVASQLYDVTRRFLYPDAFTITPGGPIPPLSDDVRREVAELKEQIRFHHLTYSSMSLSNHDTKEDSNWLVFPHHPDTKSLVQQRDWADGEIAAKDEPSRLQKARKAKDTDFSST